jgi:hypothetical protein
MYLRDAHGKIEIYDISPVVAYNPSPYDCNDSKKTY